MQRFTLASILTSCVLVAGTFAQAPGAHWTRTLTPSDPPLRRENPGVSDGTYMYVFGGKSSAGPLMNDLWRFDGAAWDQRTADGAPGSPPARYRSGVTWDFARDRLVVFGGRDSTGTYLGDTWEWDPNTNTWADVTPIGTSPSAREFLALAYDENNNKVLLFGGQDASGDRNDTWLFDGTTSTWTALSPSGSLPAVRRQHVMVERPEFDDIIMCVGQNTSALADTWQWDGASWTRIVTANTPAGKVAIDAAYDQIRQRIVIASGNPGPTGLISEFDSLTNDWIRRPLDSGIYKVTRYFMAFVPEQGKTYKVSGQALNGTTPPQYTYEYQSDFVATFSPQGTACAGTAGTPTIDGSGLAWVGESIQLAVGPVGTATTFFVLGFSDQFYTGLPLPLDMGPYGAPSCNLYVSMDATFTVSTPVSGYAYWTAPIPTDGLFLGLSFYNQGLVFDPPANTLSLVFSDYATSTIGVK